MNIKTIGDRNLDYLIASLVMKRTVIDVPFLPDEFTFDIVDSSYFTDAGAEYWQSLHSRTKSITPVPQYTASRNACIPVLTQVRDLGWTTNFVAAIGEGTSRWGFITLTPRQLMEAAYIAWHVNDLCNQEATHVKV